MLPAGWLFSFCFIFFSFSSHVGLARYGPLLTVNFFLPVDVQRRRGGCQSGKAVPVVVSRERIAAVRLMACWPDRMRLGRERCQSPPHEPSNSLKWMPPCGRRGCLGIEQDEPVGGGEPAEHNQLDVKKGCVVGWRMRGRCGRPVEEWAVNTK